MGTEWAWHAMCASALKGQEIGQKNKYFELKFSFSAPNKFEITESNMKKFNK